MSKKHIGIIYAGGTIGMTQTASGYAPGPDFSLALHRLLNTVDGALPGFALHQYAHPIDSAHATPLDWQHIGRDIAARYSGHDGFVVLHGTDTMAYTAAALSFMLQGVRKPVILTGSQVPLEAPGSDAPQNLIGALQLAASDHLSEVAIFFDHLLLRGNRSIKASSERFNAFESPNYPALAHLGISGGWAWNRAALLARAGCEQFELPDYGHARVLSLRCTPGMPQCALDALLATEPQALILECYGAGNAPDRDPAFLNALQRASAAGTVLLARSQCAQGKVAIGTYAAGAGMLAAGVVGAGDMTFEALYAKLHHLFAVGLAPEAVRAAVPRDLAGELTV
jgi:L-asparaginase